jgi:hypothetical protein
VTLSVTFLTPFLRKSDAWGLGGFSPLAGQDGSRFARYIRSAYAQNKFLRVSLASCTGDYCQQGCQVAASNTTSDKNKNPIKNGILILVAGAGFAPATSWL